jgi:hypothetical protein
MSHRTRTLVLVACAAAFALAAGCGDGKLKCHPVSGQVLYNGEPLKGVDVAFHPADPKNDTGYPPHATTDADGKFTLMTYVTGDGAPAGEWKVAVAFAVQAVDEGSDQAAKLPFQVPPQYQRKESTPLTASVKPGANALEPFKLEGPPRPKGGKK